MGGGHGRSWTSMRAHGELTGEGKEGEGGEGQGAPGDGEGCRGAIGVAAQSSWLPLRPLCCMLCAEERKEKKEEERGGKRKEGKEEKKKYGKFSELENF
jgi:hypothetical protein